MLVEWLILGVILAILLVGFFMWRAMHALEGDLIAIHLELQSTREDLTSEFQAIRDDLGRVQDSLDSTNRSVDRILVVMSQREGW